MICCRARPALRPPSSQTITPLPAVSPSALTTNGRLSVLHEPARRFVIVKDAVFSRRDVVLAHKILGERFRASKLRGRRRRPQDRQSRRLKRIHDARRQRHFRADHGQIDLLPLRKGHQRREIASGDRHIRRRAATASRGGGPFRAGVARRDKDLLDLRRTRQRPGEGVFAPAGTNDQNAEVALRSS